MPDVRKKVDEVYEFIKKKHNVHTRIKEWKDQGRIKMR